MESVKISPKKCKIAMALAGHHRDNDYMNNYIKIYRMLQCKEVIWLWIHPAKMGGDNARKR